MLIKNLTGLRFYMAMWVVIYHVKDAVNVYFLSEIINLGYLGVDVFFVLSGFILTHVYYSKFFASSFSWPHAIRFIQKRFARIYPLHFFTLILAVIYILMLKNFINSETEVYVSHLIPHLTLTHAWGFLEGIRWNFPSWSVSAEWFAYLFIFPLIHYMYRRWRMFVLQALTVISVFLLMFITRDFYSNDLGLILSSGILRIVPEFMIGALAYLAFKHKAYSSFYLLVALIAIAFLVFHNVQILIVLVVPIFLLALFKGSPLVNLLFGNKMIFWLGEVSYSIYMMHYFSREVSGIIHRNFIAGSNVNDPSFFLIYVALTLAFATATYYMVEIPCRKWINNIKLTST